MVLPTLALMAERAEFPAQGQPRSILKKTGAFIPFLKKRGSNILGVLFVAIVGWLLWDTLAELDWQKTWRNIRSTPWPTVVTTLTLTFLSYLIYVSYDLIELLRSQKKRPKFPAAVMAAWSCYAVNFNFGSLFGGVGMRLKLYTDLQISKQRVGRIVALSTISNWLGYAMISGVILVFSPHLLEEFPGLRHLPLRPLGLFLLSIIAVALILLKTKRHLRIKSFSFELPSFREGLVRIGLGILNWSVISAIYVGIFSNHYQAEQVIVIVSGLVSAVAGVITHIPGGVGVLEATFLAAIGKDIGSSAVIAGLLFFRAIYYLLPLAVACMLLIVLKAFPKLKTPLDKSEVK